MLIALLSMCFANHSALSQPVYGTVIDASNSDGIADVEVKLQNINISTTTDQHGYFYIPAHHFISTDTTQLHGELLISGRTLIWHFTSSIDLLIINVQGQLIHHDLNAGTDGELHLSNLANGVYFVNVSSPLGKRSYTLVGTGNAFNIARHEQIVKTTSVIADTLLFTNDDYYAAKLHYQSYNIGEVEQRVVLLRKSYDNLFYFNILLNELAFDMISSKPAKTHLGDVSSVKLIIDSDADLIYYMNTQVYNSHYTFAQQHLDYKYSHAIFNTQQYLNNPKRYLYPITLNYFKELDLYTFEFFSGDGANCSDVIWCYERLRSTSYLSDNLFFYATNESWKHCNDVPTITPNELYEGQNYQALNLVENYGYLQKLEIDDIANTDLQRHDIVLINGIPIDIPVIAGIITTEFQTPLSHINVLSHNRGTPNMALRDGFTNPKLDFAAGELVYLNVLSDTFYIRSASIQEATAFWSNNEPQDTVVLFKDTGNYGMINLDDADIDDVSKIGGKASNFAEMLNAFADEGMEAPVPEGHFAIPFYYYQKHLIDHGLESHIEEMLKDEDFISNSGVRKSKLQLLRDSIINAPLSTDLMNAVVPLLLQDERFSAYRFRSSTNAEDLEGFNGAGLYSSFTGKLNDQEKPVDVAIKKVWASLWNYSAFEEREYFKIDHLSCAMGVLVHRSFPDEDANGVVITHNPYNTNHGFIVNVQYGEISIVDPDPGVIHDHLVIYDFSISGQTPYTLEYFSYSNALLHSNGNVMSDAELYQLGNYLSIIKEYFYDEVYDCDCIYKDFALDVEFKIDSDVSPRKLYIKQVRPY